MALALGVSARRRRGDSQPIASTPPADRRHQRNERRGRGGLSAGRGGTWRPRCVQPRARRRGDFDRSRRRCVASSRKSVNSEFGVGPILRRRLGCSRAGRLWSDESCDDHLRRHERDNERRAIDTSGRSCDRGWQSSVQPRGFVARRDKRRLFDEFERTGARQRARELPDLGRRIFTAR